MKASRKAVLGVTAAIAAFGLIGAAPFHASAQNDAPNATTSATVNTATLPMKEDAKSSIANAAAANPVVPPDAVKPEGELFKADFVEYTEKPLSGLLAKYPGVDSVLKYFVEPDDQGVTPKLYVADAVKETGLLIVRSDDDAENSDHSYMGFIKTAEGYKSVFNISTPSEMYLKASPKGPSIFVCDYDDNANAFVQWSANAQGQFDPLVETPKIAVGNKCPIPKN